MKTTARTVVGLIVVLGCVQVASAGTGPLLIAAETVIAQAVVAEAKSEKFLTDREKRGLSDDLLNRARQAMSEGRLDATENLLKQAESLDVHYNPLNPISDTPAKVRRDLTRRQASAANKSGGSSGIFSSLPFGGNKSQAPTTDPLNRNQTKKEMEYLSAQKPANQVAASAKAPAPGVAAAVTPLPPVAHGGDFTPAAIATDYSRPAPSAANMQLPHNGDNATRAKCDNLILNARRALAMGDTNRATKLLEEAKAYRVSFGPSDDTPALVETAVKKYADFNVQAAERKGTESYRRQYARLMMEQAEALLKWNDFDEAERLVTQAAEQRVDYSPVETNPQRLLERITAARRNARGPQSGQSAAQMSKGGDQDAGFSYAADVTPASPVARQKMNDLLKQARAALSAGDVQKAETLARAAADMRIPEAMFAPGEDRPGLVLLDIQKSKSSGGVVQASANMVAPATGALPETHQATQAYYNPAGDQTRNMPAAYAQPYLAQNGPTPAPPQPMDAAQPIANGLQPQQQTPGMKFFAEGEAALRARDLKKALESFQQAATYKEQLDPLTAQRLQDHLQLLSQPPSGGAAAVPQQSLVEESAASQQVLARQVLNDVTRQESRAAQLRESDPISALNLLEQARERVDKAGLEPEARTAVLRRLDRGIGEMKQFIQDNRARIELNDRNRAVLAEIDRAAKYELEVQERLAELVEQYNQKMDEQSFEEAEVIAKRAVELAPDNLTANQLLLNAKFIRRYQNNQSIIAAKEAGFLDQLESVLDASTPFDDRFPYRLPTDWKELSGRRAALVEKYRPARSEREVEIEQKLKTPVSVRFTNAPLSVVLEHLAQLAQVNLFIDPQGLQEEGISSDSPVTINLQRDISLKSALHLILQPMHLDYVIKDEVLKITSEQYRAGTLYTMTYNVADLVIPIPNFVPNARMGMSGAYNEGVGRVGFGGSGTFGGAAPPLGVFGDTSQTQGKSVSAGVLAAMGQGGGMMGGQMGGTGSNTNMPTGFGPGGLGGGSQADFDSLIELITSTIAPESWSDVGGEGSISEYENNLTLVVSQTQEVHEDIVDLLEQLRRLQDLQVTIEVRFITLNDNFFERIGVDFDFDLDDDIGNTVFGRESNTDGGDDGGDDGDDDGGNNNNMNTDDVDHDRSVVVGLSAPGVFSADLDIPFTQGSYDLAIPQFGGFDGTAGASLGFAILSDIEAYFFINAAQGDKRTNVLQAPKVTLFNGQQATVSDSSQKPFVMGLVPVVGDFAVAQQPVIVILSEGTSLTVQAVVSADRRFVRLTVVPFFSNIGAVDTFTFTGETTTTSDTSTEGPQTTPDDSTKKNNVRSTSTQGSTVQLPTYSFVTVTTTVSVPDGGTVLLGGIKRLSEGRNEFGTPILNKIPYVSRLFRNVAIGRETQSLMMMVTPRIIIQEEEEERIGVVPTTAGQ